MDSWFVLGNYVVSENNSTSKNFLYNENDKLLINFKDVERIELFYLDTFEVVNETSNNTENKEDTRE